MQDEMSDLILACYRNDKNMVNQLLEYVDIEMRGSFGETALEWAYYNGNLDIIKLLRNKGADYNVRDMDGLTYIHYACCGNQLDIVSKFLDNCNIYGKDPNVLDNHKRTFLHLAASGGFSDMVMLLLDRGFDIEAKDKNGRTPLYYATLYKRYNAEKILLKHGASINVDCFNDLSINKQDFFFLACEVGRLDIVKQLSIDEDVNINKQNIDGISPIYMAVKSKNKELVSFLIQNNANVGINGIQNESIDGEYIIHLVCIHGNILQFINSLNTGSTINKKNEFSLCPLHYAVHYGKKDIVKFILRKDIVEGVEDVKNCKVGNSTFLHIAIECMRLDIVRKILNKEDMLYENEPDDKENERFIKFILGRRDDKNLVAAEYACSLYIKKVKIITERDNSNSIFEY